MDKSALLRLQRYIEIELANHQGIRSIARELLDSLDATQYRLAVA